MRKGLVEKELGRKNVVEEQSKGRSLDICDPRIAAVQGNLISTLIRDANQELDPDLVFLVNRGLADLDRALMFIRTSRTHSRRNTEDERKLDDIREELHQLTGSTEDHETLADALWEKSQSQAGFVLVARTLYRKAVNAGKGKLFRAADDYCIRCFGKIEQADCNIDGVFQEVALHNLCRWRFPMFGVSESSLDWKRVEQLSAGVLSDKELVAEPFTRFVHAVALAHLGRWQEARGHFRQLRDSRAPRDIVFVARCVLVDDQGAPKRVEGVVTRTSGKTFLKVAELETDFECDRKDKWRQDGEMDFAYVEFSFAGARAIGDLASSIRWGF